MPDQIKKHTTVAITEEMLQRHMPCGPGLDCARPLLPAKFSTDPHKNLKLADKWTKTDRPFDLSWLTAALCDLYITTPDEYDEVRLVDETYDWSRDAWVVAQNMAIIADHLATKEGR
jgi:hypothetical protein